MTAQVRRVRRRPNVIEICGPWDGTEDSWVVIKGFAGGLSRADLDHVDVGPKLSVWNDQDKRWLDIPRGHYVARGSGGELYPLSPQAYESTFDDITDAVVVWDVEAVFADWERLITGVARWIPHYEPEQNPVDALEAHFQNEGHVTVAQVGAIEQVERLSDWFRSAWPDAIVEGGAVENAIRLLGEYQETIEAQAARDARETSDDFGMDVRHR